MQNKASWKLKIAKIKGDIAREVKQDYLAGFTIPEIMQMYGLTKKTVYKWIVVSEDDKRNHYSQIMSQNKMGRPKVKGNKKRAIKITEVAKQSY